MVLCVRSPDKLLTVARRPMDAELNAARGGAREGGVRQRGCGEEVEVSGAGGQGGEGPAPRRKEVSAKKGG